MFFDSDNSKEAIKSRMLRMALNYWDTRNTDELDPLVKLLMEALSAELYDIINDIKTAEGRILEKMAQLLAPDLLTAPSPAHAVMHALPAELNEYITDEDQFCVEKKIASKQDGPLDASIDVYFTPVNKVRLFDARVAFAYSGFHLHAIDATMNKMLVATSKEMQRNESSIWLGIDCRRDLAEINGMNFLFDLKNIDSAVADYFYRFLPLTRWFIEDHEIKIFSGADVTERDNTKKEVSITDNGIMRSTRSNINNYYSKRFITIIERSFTVSAESQRRYPREFEKLFPLPVLANLTQDLLWVKIVFPSKIQQELLNELNITMNAVLVMNCKKNELKYRLRGGRNIIPIPNVANERFLDIKSFTDGVIQFKVIPFRKAGEEEVGTYTLRTGGVERFDTRNGKEMIAYMLELLRSESAAFSAYGYDFIASTLKEMNQLIALMEQKTNIAVNDATEIPYYIIAKPAAEDREMMFIDYWTTNMTSGNNIRSGTRLQQLSGVALKTGSLTLLTATTGGKDKLKSEEKLHAFKYGLLTRDRIVTVEDIRSFCFYELGNRIDNVTVKRGFAISDNPKEGAKRTIDVILKPVDEITDKEDWEKLCGQLISKLVSRSGMSYNYRVMRGI